MALNVCKQFGPLSTEIGEKLSPCYKLNVTTKWWMQSSGPKSVGLILQSMDTTTSGLI